MWVIIFAGNRLDLFAHIQEKGQELWPDRAPFLTLMQQNSVQTWTARASYAVTFLHKSDTEVPSMLTVPRASPDVVLAEGLPLRCRCSRCPFRLRPPRTDFVGNRHG